MQRGNTSAVAGRKGNEVERLLDVNQGLSLIILSTAEAAVSAAI